VPTCLRKGTSGRTNHEGIPRPLFQGASHVRWGGPLPRRTAEAANRIPTQPEPRRDVTASSQRRDHLYVKLLPLGVHTGDHVGVHTGDQVRAPPPAPGEAAAHRGCRGIRWYPRLACPQAGRHIGAGCVVNPITVRPWSPCSSVSPSPSLTFLICLFHSLFFNDAIPPVVGVAISRPWWPACGGSPTCGNRRDGGGNCDRTDGFLFPGNADGAPVRKES
jgi:hypothetical protein